MKPDTDRMLLNSDVTYYKLFVLCGYNNVNREEPNIYFLENSVFTTFTEWFVQTTSGMLLKFLKKII